MAESSHRLVLSPRRRRDGGVYLPSVSVSEVTFAGSWLSGLEYRRLTSAVELPPSFNPLKLLLTSEAPKFPFPLKYWQHSKIWKSCHASRSFRFGYFSTAICEVWPEKNDASAHTVSLTRNKHSRNQAFLVITFQRTSSDRCTFKYRSPFDSSDESQRFASRAVATSFFISSSSFTTENDLHNSDLKLSLRKAWIAILEVDFVFRVALRRLRF